MEVVIRGNKGVIQNIITRNRLHVSRGDIEFLEPNNNDDVKKLRGQLLAANNKIKKLEAKKK